MEDAIIRRIAAADRDLLDAQKMFGMEMWQWVVYTCHRALEKLFKAHVMIVTGKLPPRTHNLTNLAETAGITGLSPDQNDFLGDLTQQRTPSAYAEEFGDRPEYDCETARYYLDGTQEVYQWVRARLT